MIDTIIRDFGLEIIRLAMAFGFGLIIGMPVMFTLLAILSLRYGVTIEDLLSQQLDPQVLVMLISMIVGLSSFIARRAGLMSDVELFALYQNTGVCLVRIVPLNSLPYCLP